MKSLLGRELLMVDKYGVEGLCFVAYHKKDGITIKSLETQKDVICINCKTWPMFHPSYYYSRDDLIKYIEHCVELGFYEANTSNIICRKYKVIGGVMPHCASGN